MKFTQSPKKSLGQNFLIDKNILNKIIKVGNIDKNSIVLEIGAGYGSLTESILNMEPRSIFAIEKDEKLSIYLKKKFKKKAKVKIINEDILEVINKKFTNKNIIIFGNLPYNISTKILASLIMLNKWPPWYDHLILMFQKEVANRIIAKSHTKDFGRLSILTNWRLDVKKHFDISKNCFFPKPKIDSTLLSFKPIKKPLFNLNNPKNLESITRILFSNRRKMINKNFKKLFKNNISILKKLKINPKKRPEELSYEVFYKIAIEYENSIS